MTFNPLGANFASFIQIDKIIGTFSGSFVSTQPSVGTPTTTVVNPITTNISDYTFFQGIFSIDGGTTWNDFGYNKFPLQILGLSQPNTFNIIAVNKHSYVNPGSDSAYTVQFKVALIAKPGQGIITPQLISGKVFFNSNFNYQKILSDTSQPLSITAGNIGTLTFPHSLGYIPKVRTFIYTTILSFGTGLYELTSMDNYGYGCINVSEDTTNVNINIDNTPYSGTVSGTVFARIYYD